MPDAERAAWQQKVADLSRDWSAAADSGVDPASDVAQALARRHVEWLRSIPGTPAEGGGIAQYVLSLGDMYVADPRFAANYGGADGATFVRDALRVYVEANL